MLQSIYLYSVLYLIIFQQNKKIYIFLELYELVMLALHLHQSRDFDWL